jgi:hypothetical protein
MEVELQEVAKGLDGDDRAGVLREGDQLTFMPMMERG